MENWINWRRFSQAFLLLLPFMLFWTVSGMTPVPEATPEGKSHGTPKAAMETFLATFDPVMEGETVMLSFTIANTGESPLEISQVATS